MSKPPVVIMRKDKRIRHKLTHAVFFAVTGGASGIVTAAEAANHAAYNAHTRKLQAQSEENEHKPWCGDPALGRPVDRCTCATPPIISTKDKPKRDVATPIIVIFIFAIMVIVMIAIMASSSGTSTGS